ncbi:hypothetical protein [Streptomyces sp. 8N616]|uniref:hypothetical protein n=1 Tax=Streptomyces sp. 8N616 TaxID=3457414 RepID=UPI003FD6458E
MCLTGLDAHLVENPRLADALHGHDRPSPACPLGSTASPRAGMTSFIRDADSQRC